jgi:phage tail sheath protein FI
MPEYLAPGVYVEEVSFRQKSIEGVSTSVAAFIGPVRYGPVGDTPELLTSFSDFTRIYGGIDNLEFDGDEVVNYVAHAVQAFFTNGGQRLYVTRVYDPAEDASPGEPNDGKAFALLDSPGDSLLRARFPGRTGNMRVTFAVRSSANIRVGDKLNSVRDRDVVAVVLGDRNAAGNGIYDVGRTDSGWSLTGTDGTARALSDARFVNARIHRLTVSVIVHRWGQFEDDVVFDELAPARAVRGSLPDLFVANPESRASALTVPFELATDLASGAEILALLVGDDVLTSVGQAQRSRAELLAQSPDGEIPSSDELSRTFVLAGGSDGQLPPAVAYEGEADTAIKTGLKTFEDIDEISIVAAPGATARYGDNPQRADQIIQSLLAHCQIVMKYRVAVLESPDNQILSEVRDFRGKFDSTHAALYYPWLTVVDPIDPDGRREIQISPSGFVSGIYARTDITHGVFKAPANEVAIGAIDFERLLNKAEQDVLNPLGINCFRFFENRGFRLWGARTISSDPEWKYISVRRYFAYLSHSIDRGTQWAVFENNSEPLWANVRRTIEDFLVSEWRNGALLGTKPEEAFFVRCDRSTMTQNDLDNGRLVCLIGVAVVKPAEFVIFRIGQMTAGSKH